MTLSILLINAQAGQRFFEQSRVDRQAASVGLHIFEFIEGAEETQLDCGVLLGVIQRTSVSFAPCGARALREKNTHGVGQPAVGSDVKNKFRGGSFRIVGQRRPFAHEVVLVDKSLRTGVGLQTAEGWIRRHADIMERGMAVCRGLGFYQRRAFAILNSRKPHNHHESSVTKVILSWSSGKDSAWTLHLLRQKPDIQVAALLTTFNSQANRVAMHAVRRTLVEAQAERTGIPLWAVELPWPCSNLEYEDRMRAACQRATAKGITAVAFGDLFLQDVRDYRIRQLRGSGLEPLFPVWQIPTKQLSREMIAAGVKAKITCVDPSKLAKPFVGQDYDSRLLQALPLGIDPCGENGEFHTFVYDAPVFSRPISVRTGEVVERDGFVFADLLPE